MIREYPFAVSTFTIPFIPYQRPFPFPCHIPPFCLDVMNVEAHEDDLSEGEINVLTFEPQIAWGEMSDTRFQVISSSGFGIDECEDWEDEDDDEEYEDLEDEYLDEDEDDEWIVIEDED